MIALSFYQFIISLAWRRVDFVINSAGYKISPEILEEKINTIFKSECIATGIEDDTFGK